MELQTDPSSRKKRRRSLRVRCRRRDASATCLEGSPVIKPDPEAEMHAANALGAPAHIDDVACEVLRRARRRGAARRCRRAARGAAARPPPRRCAPSCGRCSTEREQAPPALAHARPDVRPIRRRRRGARRRGRRRRRPSACAPRARARTPRARPTAIAVRRPERARRARGSAAHGPLAGQFEAATRASRSRRARSLSFAGRVVHRGRRGYEYLPPDGAGRGVSGAAPRARPVAALRRDVRQRRVSARSAARARGGPRAAERRVRADPRRLGLPARLPARHARDRRGRGACGVTTATDTGRASSRRSSASACRARCSARGSPTRSTLSRRASRAGRSTSRAVTALAGTAIVHGRATHGRWSSWTRSLALSSEDFGQRTRRRRKPRLACAESCAGANLWPGASSGGMRRHATTTT